MNIKCGLCGKDIVVADGLADGQHVQCPYCGGKSEYRKPTRIELPSGAVNRHHMAKEESGGDDEVPEIPAYKRNPNLYIRRPGGGDEWRELTAKCACGSGQCEGESGGATQVDNETEKISG